MVYAFTLMYGREESEPESYIQGRADNISLNPEFGNDREVENLLRAFIKSSDKDKKGD